MELESIHKTDLFVSCVGFGLSPAKNVQTFQRLLATDELSDNVKPVPGELVMTSRARRSAVRLKSRWGVHVAYLYVAGKPRGTQHLGMPNEWTLTESDWQNISETQSN